MIKSRWDSAKFKTFYILSLRKNNGTTAPITCLELCYLTGIKVCTLASALSRWTNWKYLRRVPLFGQAAIYRGPGGSWHFCKYGYTTLTQKGEHWIPWFSEHYLPLTRQYIRELIEHQRSQK